MIEGFAVGSRFVITDEASAKLQRIAREFEELDKVAKKAAASIEAFGKLKFPTLLGELGRVDELLAGISTSAGKTHTALEDALNTIKLPELTGELDAVKLGIAGIGKEAETASRAMVAAFDKAGTDMVAGMRATIAELTAQQRAFAAGSGGGGGAAARNMRARADGSGGHGGGGHGGMGFGAYNRGMHLPGGTSVHPHAGGDGFLELIGGAALAEAAKKITESGMEFQHWTAEMKGAGADQVTIADAVGAAWENAGKNVNTTATEGLKQILELNKATGDWHESMKLLPAFSVAQFAMQSVKAEDLHSKFNSGTQTLNFARGLEELGVTQMGKTPEERLANIQRYSNELTRTMVGLKGTFDGNQLFAMTNNSGGVAQNWDERFATVEAPIMGAIMKASKLGNADYMALRSYAGGHITSDAVQALMKYGLAKSGTDTYEDSKHQWHLKPNSQFAEGMMANTWDWSGTQLEKLKAAGFDPSNQKQMAEMVNEIGSNKSTGAIMRLLFEPLTRLQIQKEMTIRDRVPDDAADVLQKNDPLLKMAAMKDKWDDLMNSISGPLTDKAMAAIEGLTGVFGSMAQFFHENPKVADAASGGILAGAAGLLTAGAAKMLGYGGVLGKLFGGALGATSLPSLIDTVTDPDNRSDQAKKNDQAVIDAVKGWFGPSAHSSYVDPGAYERSRRGDDEFRRDPEAAHARALSGMAPAISAAITTGAIDAKPGVQTAISDSSARGTLAGLMAAYDPAKALLTSLFKTAASGALGGGGSMIQNASYSPGGGFGGFGGGGFGGSGGGRGFGGGGGGGNFNPGTLGGAGSLTDLITQSAKSVAGGDPAKERLIRQTMEGIRNGESLHKDVYDKYITPREQSYGPFQLNRASGLGITFERETAAERARLGLGDLTDPRTIAMQTAWVAKYIADGRSMAPWRGGNHPLREADPSWGNSGYVGAAPALSGSDYSGLNILPGHGATAGGAALPGLVDAAKWLQANDPGLVGFTALNDSLHNTYGHGHSGPGGIHSLGLAFDAASRNIKGSKGALRNYLSSLGFAEGGWGSGAGDFSMEPGAGGGTGPHMHFQFNSAAAAERFAKIFEHQPGHYADDSLARAHRAAEREMAKPDSGEWTQNHHIYLDGSKIASVVSKHQNKRASFPSQSPNHNRYAHPTAPDYGAIAFA